MDVELQQRAVEYLSLERRPELARANVTPMPPWEKRKSLLLRRMAEREARGPGPYPGAQNTLPRSQQCRGMHRSASQLGSLLTGQTRYQQCLLLDQRCMPTGAE